ncbi:hypothetical protein V2J09_011819, partial [Rumex salicifolius]
ILLYQLPLFLLPSLSFSTLRGLPADLTFPALALGGEGGGRSLGLTRSDELSIQFCRNPSPNKISFRVGKIQMHTQGRAQGLPNNFLEGSSNWQEILGHGASSYPQPLELHNYDTVFHDSSASVQASLLPSTSSGYGNGGLIDESYAQPLNLDDGSWEQLLSLMEAPSSAPDNVLVNKSFRAPMMNSPYVAERSNLMQSMMRSPPESNWNGMQHKSINAYSQESSYQMQHNFTSSTPPMDQSHYASIHRHNNSLPYMIPDGFPVCYDSPYNLNNTRVDASSGITSSPQFAPLTPQPVKRSHQYSAAMDLSLDQSLSQYKIIQDNLMASSIRHSSHFAPATPQPAKAVDIIYQSPTTQSLSLDQIQKQEKFQQDIVPGSIEIESTGRDCQGLLDNFLDSSSTAIGTSFKERNGPQTEEIQNIDLNKTPAIKAPRRKKHRPKVIRENKPPRNRNPATEKVGPDGIAVPKRKYVRKNESNATKTPQEGVSKKTKDSATKPALKSCRKSLHFELEDDISDTMKEVDQQEKQYQAQENIFQDINAQEAEFSIGSNHSTGMNSAQRSNQRNAQIRENNEGGITISLHPSVHRIQRVDNHQRNQHMFGTHPVTKDGLTNNSYMIPSQESKGAAVLSENVANGYQVPGYHPLYAGVGQTLQEITAHQELERTRQIIEQIQKRRASQYIQSRGSKRDYALASSGISTNTTHSQFCPEIFQNEPMRTNGGLDQCYSGTQKRTRIEKLSHTTNSSIQYSTRFADNRLHQAQFNRYPVNHFLEVNGGLINPYHRNKTFGDSNSDPASGCINLTRHPISSEASLGKEMLAEKEAKTSALANVINSISMLPYPNMQNQITLHANSRTQSLMTETTNKSNHAIVPINKHKGESVLCKPAANKTGKRLKQKKTVSVDDITDQLRCLNLDSTNNQMLKDEQKALVPYKGNGTIVLYEGFDPLKKRKPRPKVDLDPETNRLWNLLMGKEASDNEKQTDEQKTKWWEEQRNVFRGRADSFIARMHLVQGDRRFSPWKGSVVDSVIGVFLTQNVTDHLSSSAFMSLAAQFPPQSIRRDSDLQKPVKVSAQSLDELVSSQDSAESSIVQMNGSVQSLYMSGLTADCPTNGCQSISRYSTMSFIIEEMENHARFPNSRSQDSGSLNFKTATDEHLQPQNEEAREQKKLDGTYSFDLNRLANSCQLPEAGGLVLAETDGSNTLRSQHYMSLQSTAVSKDMGVTSIGTEQEHKKTWPTLHQQTNMIENVTASYHPIEASSAQKSILTAEEPTMPKSNVSKEKGRKVEGVKKTIIDWDCLRRQVKSQGEQKERSQNTMDSIDYEALQNADVSKISDIIRERGMNNMLAERIKEFLDRLLRDHGSMDLEWLRDAPPDKAKDYLLSIRGLGLKSVECIRLLTLHQHAFPVDTNVGRIAVRLGWVPLQPLPESLQLHLLEMYPILESVQKYLYPRLCNLDQRTLYELHYQLITFGKVFCTKTKPNCNACPMRGECRHFASAFASSRLALPGPEEKSVVTTESPIETRRDPTIGGSLLLMPSLQDAKPEETTLANRTCEPIIEEPSSPEPESTEISEIVDIEEAFYEDSDEIPTIRLNVEEFTQNLQIFMQEGDMSKALVAFDPQAASIPTAKLKNVSRLRTEHQVYQLPDSHPLLKELDKREPDDPSPYLLAIWTPGETANSIQPPEGICNFSESGQLCSEKACFTCNSVRESNAQTVRGTLLIPCRTAMRGSFPLNGTYFQVNEVFADHESSLNPIDVPREWIWNLPRSTVYFGTSVSAIFRGMSTEEIQQCFWRGFVCVRGFDKISRIPRPLMARLHFSASKQMREADKKKAK